LFKRRDLHHAGNIKVAGNFHTRNQVMKLGLNRSIFASSAVAAALSSLAHSQTTWTGATDGSWATPGNWSAGVPDSADLVTYGSGNTVGIAVTNAPQTLDASSAVLGFTIGNDVASPISISSGSGANTLSIGTSGILLNSGTGGSFTLNTDVILSGNQSWVTGNTRTISANKVDLANFQLTLNAAGTGNNTTIAGLITGTGGITKTGGNNAFITGSDNSFGGELRLSNGTLNVNKLADIGSNSSIGTGNAVPSIVMNGGTLAYNGAGGDTTNRAIDMRANAAINNNSTTGTLSITAANVIQGGTASARTLTLGGSHAGNNTFHSILGNSGTGTNISSLQKNGLGKWIITGIQSYTGSTVINAGTLSVSGGTVLGGASGSTADASNIIFGQNLNSGRLEFETTANLGAASQIRFRNTLGGLAGQGGALIYSGSTDQTLGKTLQCDSNVGIRIESNSVGGKLLVTGAISDNGARPLFLGGSGTGSNEFQSALSGTRSVTKRDSGQWILSNTNTYNGSTNVTGGTLTLGASGSLGNTTTTIGSDATLSGGGSIGGATTIEGTHSPGFSPGTQTFTNGLSYTATATLNWELIANTTDNRGSSYDAVNVSGGSFALATGATIDLSFSGGTVDFLNEFWGLNQEWRVIDLSDTATAADSNLFSIGTITGGANWDPTLGNFGTLRKSGSNSADSVYLTWTAIPEPNTTLLGGIGMLFLLRRRNA
jgi:autotransporter-associated beta strand protein